MVRAIKNLIAATLISISGFLIWTQVWPVYQVTTAIKPKIVERSDFLQTRMELIDKVSQLKKEKDEKYIEFQRLSLIIPPKKSIPETISMIESMFTQTGNNLSGITLGESFSETFVKHIFIQLSSQGTYESIQSALGVIESSLRIFDVTSLSISEDVIQGAAENSLSFQIKGDIYWIAEDEIL